MCRNFCVVLASLSFVVVLVVASKGNKQSVVRQSLGRQRMDSGSGDDLEDGGDDDDDDDSDFDGSGAESDCVQLRNKIKSRKLAEAYVPQCTPEGEFNPVHCIEERRVRECFCIDIAGQRIPGTQVIHPNSPNCTKIDRNKFLMAVIQKTTPFVFPVAAVATQVTRRSSLTAGISTRQSSKTVCPRCQRLTTPAAASNLERGQPTPQKTLDSELVQGTSAQGRKSTSSGNGWVYVKTRPTLLAGIIGGVAVALMCTVLLLLFIVYRLRKKDEGSYALDEPKNSPAVAYTKANDREFFA